LRGFRKVWQKEDLENGVTNMAQDSFDVFLRGEHIDTVFASVGAYDAQEMKRSLVNHDGYDPSIEVKKTERNRSKGDPK
jgi:CRISPR/Cas system-associated exonuclease Cas4 (RecB family)